METPKAPIRNLIENVRRLGANTNMAENFRMDSVELLNQVCLYGIIVVYFLV